MASPQTLPHFFALAFLASFALLLTGSHLSAQEKKSPDKAVDENVVDQNFKAYFAGETAKLAERCLKDLTTLEEWKTRRVELRRQLFEMLGLDPLPEKTDLKPVVTKTVEGEGFKVECLHFQSSPGLYVTGNLYIPNEVDEKLPAILYVCGHGGVKKDGISYGNKVHYQHHGAWFARNGYVCLTIDSLQLGEIEGIHHGTYKYNMWWWINRGYTPAGVEAWNCIRALDYLATRPEVDMEKIGVTGRSGGGAYSWWIAALDERIKVAVPVAGITDLQNHVVDGCVEGHCDCMFFNNTYRWDYPMVAALVAPRPLLISNTDRDRIFPLDGVYRTYKKVRKVYELYEKPEDVALHITAGPHKDTQELRIHAFRWFNHYLKGTDEPIRTTADKFFEPEQLRVFDKLPDDSINAKIHETFVPLGKLPKVPETAAQWREMQTEYVKTLREKTFGGWPQHDCDLNLKMIRETKFSEMVLQEFHFDSQPGVRLRLFLVMRAVPPENPRIVMSVDDGSSPERIRSLLAASNKDFERERRDVLESISIEGELGMSDIGVYLLPRGVEAAAKGNKLMIHDRRRFALLGQTLDGMKIYDILRALAVARQVIGKMDAEARFFDDSNSHAIYASMFDEHVTEFNCSLSGDLQIAIPVLWNASRYEHQAVTTAVIAGHAKVKLDVKSHNSKGKTTDDLKNAWKFTEQVDRLLDRNQFTMHFNEAAEKEDDLPKLPDVDN